MPKKKNGSASVPAFKKRRKPSQQKISQWLSTKPRSRSATNSSTNKKPPFQLEEVPKFWDDKNGLFWKAYDWWKGYYDDLNRDTIRWCCPLGCGHPPLFVGIDKVQSHLSMSHADGGVHPIDHIEIFLRAQKAREEDIRDMRSIRFPRASDMPHYCTSELTLEWLKMFDSNSY
jgi:hypothetical protein